MVGFLKIEILETLPVMKASDRLWLTISQWITIFSRSSTELLKGNYKKDQHEKG